MAEIVLQYTSPTAGDIFLYDDDTVTLTDGTPQPQAVVKHEDGIPSIDLFNNGIWLVNDYPVFIEIEVTREPGWQGNLGYRVILLNLDPNDTPGNYALAIYAEPDGRNYQYTTGAFQFFEDLQQWGAVCPPGFEPGQEDIYMGILEGSAPYGCFTLHADKDSGVFYAGGK